jgi:hypothetical protein
MHQIRRAIGGQPFDPELLTAAERLHEGYLRRENAS